MLGCPNPSTYFTGLGINDINMPKCACLEHYYQVSPLYGWNQILGTLPGLTPEDLFEVAMGLSSPQRDLQSQNPPEEPTPAKVLAHCPAPSPGGTVARGPTGCLRVSQEAGSVASSHRALLPLPTLLGLYEWTLPAGAGINKHI